MYSPRLLGKFLRGCLGNSRDELSMVINSIKTETRVVGRTRPNDLPTTPSRRR